MLEVLVMPLISWTDALTVEIRALDADHQSLLSMLNQIYDAIQGGHGLGALDDIVSRLLRYTDTHFAREERLLEKHAYPGLTDHRNAHAELRGQVEAFRANVSNGTPGTDDEVALFLKNWLTRHILSQDHEYAAFLRAKGVR